MAKESMKARERKRAKVVEKYTALRAELKAKIRKGGDEGLEAVAKLHTLPRNASPTRLKNRCKITGRPKAYLRRFGVCRIIFRDLALAGKIPGITKASW